MNDVSTSPNTLWKELLDLSKNWAFAVGLLAAAGTISQAKLGLKFQLVWIVLAIVAVAVFVISAQIFVAGRGPLATLTKDSPPRHRAKVVGLIGVMSVCGWIVFTSAADYIAAIRNFHQHAMVSCPSQSVGAHQGQD